MLRRIGLALIVLAALAAGTFFWLTAPRTVEASTVPEGAGDPERGEVMFWAGGCAGCHAAPGAESGPERLVLAGGVALKTPFGTFRAPNISPHPDAGIGNWSNLDFVNAMARGVAPDGRHYYPAFPYTSYQRMTVADMVDLKAFIDTLEPVATASAAHEIGFPFNIRRGIGLWKTVHLDGEPFSPDPSGDEVLNRGKYLVEGPGHCGECHTPRNAFGGLDRAQWLAGGPNPDGDGRIPNITPHADGIADWTLVDIAYALESGFTPEFDSFGGSMVEVQRNMAMLPPEDRQAIAAYLKSVPPLPSEPSP